MRCHNQYPEGRHRISAGGKRGPTPQEIDRVRTILSPRDKVLIILELPKEIDFSAFMRKNYSRLLSAGFVFYFLDGAHEISLKCDGFAFQLLDCVSGIPHKVQQIIGAIDNKREVQKDLTLKEILPKRGKERGLGGLGYSQYD